jgi:V8-like Glu-specific endopeptidase
MVDTAPGNSGSPVIEVNGSAEMTENAVGIHTGGSCNPVTGVPNMGTGFAHEGLRNAISALNRGS